MKRNRAIQLLLIVIIGVAVGGAFGDWASSLSDALWWQRLPWALLAVFWGGLLFMLWRERHRPRV